MKALNLRKAGKFIGGAMLLLLTVVYLYPIINIVFNSLKTSGDIMRNPIGLPRSVTFENFAVAWKQLNYFQSFYNTFSVCVISIALIVIFGIAAAYPIARYNLKFNRVMYVFFIAIIMVPSQAIMIPLVRQFYDLGLINNKFSLIIFYLSSSIPFAVFLFTGFIKTIPRELDEAATIDGCGPVRSLLVVILPLLKPVIATVVILEIMGIWNDFMMPMILLQKKSARTLTPLIYDFFQEYSTQWNYVFAASLLIMFPGVLMFLSLQKYFVAGMVAGSLKS